MVVVADIRMMRQLTHVCLYACVFVWIRKRRLLVIFRDERANALFGKLSSNRIELDSTVRSESVNGPRVVESPVKGTEAEGRGFLHR